VETSAQGRETGMLDALQDLEALMVKAKDMVRLAAELNEKLTAASAPVTSQVAAGLASPAEPEEATFIRSSLSQLGLQMSNAPVTLDMMKDEKRWFEELARELAQVLQGSFSSSKEGGMMKDRGVIALDEVWGGWNRARGVGELYSTHPTLNLPPRAPPTPALHRPAHPSAHLRVRPERTAHAALHARRLLRAALEPARADRAAHDDRGRTGGGHHARAEHGDDRGCRDGGRYL